MRFWAEGLMTEQEFDIAAERLLSKVAVYPKNWQVNTVSGKLEYAQVNADAPYATVQQPYAVDDENELEIEDEQLLMAVHKTSWDRDIVAAKCILIKALDDKYEFNRISSRFSSTESAALSITNHHSYSKINQKLIL
ncbi:uncharacterized protein LOC116351243 [Contarinia nasturtii]|uniref:uncharacterized protein LOC116351243 n=1 Tax=Contarinia nasturtii TaxID=265458 RepID=UPI0012D41B63|nr:uncharacterized protein LOC116351243 [Contarinia nasturtii]